MLSARYRAANTAGARCCEDLGPKDFSAVLDRFGARLGTHDESFFTPRAVVHLIVQMLNGNLTETARIHDPYMRGGELLAGALEVGGFIADRKSTRLNSSHLVISYAVFCL